MSYAAQTNILAVLTRSELTRRRGSIHLIKLNLIEEVYEDQIPEQMTFDLDQGIKITPFTEQE